MDQLSVITDPLTTHSHGTQMMSLEVVGSEAFIEESGSFGGR